MARLGLSEQLCPSGVSGGPGGQEGGPAEVWILPTMGMTQRQEGASAHHAAGADQGLCRQEDPGLLPPRDPAPMSPLLGTWPTGG